MNSNEVANLSILRTCEAKYLVIRDRFSHPAPQNGSVGRNSGGHSGMRNYILRRLNVGAYPTMKEPFLVTGQVPHKIKTPAIARVFKTPVSSLNSNH